MNPVFGMHHAGDFETEPEHAVRVLNDKRSVHARKKYSLAEYSQPIRFD